MSRAQSRVEKTERATENKKQRKVKVVVGKGTMKLIKYSWFPLMALILFSIGICIGVYLIVGESRVVFSRDLWSSFIDALRNF